MTQPTTIAHYRITSKLGQGGMGAVYRATDVKLNREVAIKVLPDALAGDPDYLARFTREAQVLASLNHPNIAAIYGIEDRAIVMELVEGENLRGPLPLDTALNYARQITEAFEAAHEKGIIHRDLKPANVKVTPEGVVKVLDFGLAKIAAAAQTSAADSPTLTIRSTQLGVILGTAAYMSPEQAAGKPVDKRADIWSFGVVLYEMLSGAQLFEGETVAHTLADVLRADIDLAKLPASTPRAIRDLIARCLDRDPRRRLRDIGEARVILENPLAAEPPGPRTASPRPVLWIAAAVTATLAAATVATLHIRERAPDPPLVRSFIPPPPGTVYATRSGLGAAGPAVVSPDGRRIAFSARVAGGKLQLFVRSLDSLSAHALAGTEGATLPFWSPESQFIGFFANGMLKKIDASGGPAIRICEAPQGRGGSWSPDGVIVFTPNVGALHRVSASSGVSSPLKTAHGELVGRFPWFLPDGRHFLYSSGGANSQRALGIRVASLGADGKDAPDQDKLILETNSNPEFAQGRLLYLQDEATLMAQPFDLGRLGTTGEAVPLAENIRTIGANRCGVFSVSQTGVLVYETNSQELRTLAWFDRNGVQSGTLGAPALFRGLEFSPDRKTLAAPTGRKADFGGRRATARAGTET